MTHDAEDAAALEALEARLQALLPQEYQDSYEDVEPTPMGSADLKYGPDGQVAWNEIWQTFCDLAMAGGPPHKGRLLRPATPEEVDAQPARAADVGREICRGITLATGLPSDPSEEPGWIQVGCDSDGMAAWLLRAITMENVSARAGGAVLDLPSGPGYRLEKEIKNVITVAAKTCHYWSGHMWRFEQRAIADLFAVMEAESPLIVPSDALAREPVPSNAWSTAAAALRAATPLPVPQPSYPDWIGVECPSVRAAIWMMRMTVASNILARREETVLLVPLNPLQDPAGDRIANAVGRAHRLARTKGVL